MKEFTKLCPFCGNIQKYCCKRVLISSIKKNTLCNRCRQYEKKKYKVKLLEKNCSQCKSLMKYDSYLIYKRSVNGNWLCKKCATKESSNYIDRSFQKTDEYRKMMSKKIKLAWKKSKNYGSESHREKLRESKLNQIKKQGTQRTYNPNACQFIEEFGKKHGYNFQHATNGGERVIAGYSLDGYDKEKNVVFEYDEPKHHIISIKKSDKIREERIINKIHPSSFFRYDEKQKILYDIIVRKEG